MIREAPGLPHGDAEPPSGPYLLAAGDLRPRKNLLRLVEAFRRLHADGLPHRLVLAGEDVLRRGARIAEAAGGAPVDLTGRITDEELDALMRGADALVFPSLYEGFGLVVVEAMARGCPVAAPARPPCPRRAATRRATSTPSTSTTWLTLSRGRDRPRRPRGARAARAGARGDVHMGGGGRSTADVYRELVA